MDKIRYKILLEKTKNHEANGDELDEFIEMNEWLDTDCNRHSIYVRDVPGWSPVAGYSWCGNSWHFDGEWMKYSLDYPTGMAEYFDFRCKRNKELWEAEKKRIHDSVEARKNDPDYGRIVIPQELVDEFMKAVPKPTITFDMISALQNRMKEIAEYKKDMS